MTICRRQAADMRRGPEWETVPIYFDVMQIPTYLTHEGHVRIVVAREYLEMENPFCERPTTAIPVEHDDVVIATTTLNEADHFVFPISDELHSKFQRCLVTTTFETETAKTDDLGTETVFRITKIVITTSGR